MRAGLHWIAYAAPLLIGVGAFGGNHYIRAGAAGDGSDWSNAWADLPATFVRGDTYYVADGIYGSETFDTAAAGSTNIYVWKATAANHGTDVGWNTNYDASQAVFGPWAVSSPNWDFNGQRRGAGWTNGYGFVVMASDMYAWNVIDLLSTDVSNVNVRYVELCGPGLAATNYGDGLLATGGNVGNDPGVDNVTVEYCYFVGCWCNQINLLGDNWTMRYNFFDENRTEPCAHAQNVQDNGGNNRTFAFNRVRNPSGTAVYTCIGWGQTNGSYSICDNTVWNTPDFGTPEGISAFVEVIGPDQISNMQVDNNTLYNVQWWPRIVHMAASGTNRTAYNNLFFNCSPLNGSVNNWTQDYSWYYKTTHDAEPHEQDGASNAFVNAANYDFHLTSHTSPGVALPPPFNVDMDGTVRGMCGMWDRGAYQVAPAPMGLCVMFR